MYIYEEKGGTFTGVRSVAKLYLHHMYKQCAINYKSRIPVGAPGVSMKSGRRGGGVYRGYVLRHMHGYPLLNLTLYVEERSS